MRIRSLEQLGEDGDELMNCLIGRCVAANCIVDRAAEMRRVVGPRWRKGDAVADDMSWSIAGVEPVAYGCLSFCCCCTTSWARKIFFSYMLVVLLWFVVRRLTAFFVCRGSSILTIQRAVVKHWEYDTVRHNIFKIMHRA